MAPLVSFQKLGWKQEIQHSGLARLHSRFLKSCQLWFCETFFTWLYQEGFNDLNGWEVLILFQLKSIGVWQCTKKEGIYKLLTARMKALPFSNKTQGHKTSCGKNNVVAYKNVKEKMQSSCWMLCYSSSGWNKLQSHIRDGKDIQPTGLREKICSANAAKPTQQPSGP